MASGDREVNLVVRAKNEASKAIDSITSALEELNQSQADVAKGSDKTSSTLQQLGTVLGQLNKEIRGLSTMDKLTSSLEKATTSVGRLESSIASLSDEQAQLAKDTASAEAAQTKLNAQAQTLKKTLDQQGAETEQAAGSLAALTKELKSSEGTLRQAVTDNKTYERQLQQREVQLAKTGQRHRELTQEILKAETPSKRLVNTFENTDAALKKQSDGLERLKQKYAESGNAIKEIAARVATLKVSQEEAAAAFEVANVAQQKSAASLVEIGKQVKATSGQMNTLQNAATKNADALQAQSAALAKAKVELAGVEKSVSEANLAMEQVAATVRQRLLRSLIDSQAELQKYKAEWDEATAAVKRAVASGQSLSNPGPELNQALTVARASKEAYTELAIAVQQMRAAVRAAGSDTQALAAAQQTFIAALGRVESKTNAVTSAQKQQAAAGRQAADSATASANQQAAVYDRAATSSKRLTQATRENADAMKLLAGQGRQALSWSERLRSELIALATAYVGVYAAIEQLGKVTEVYQKIEAAQNRMVVAFGSAEAATKELAFIRSEAERLKVNIVDLTDEYSKFAIATKGSSLEGEQTRKIFISLSEAFRVNKLSADQMKGAFNAITQIVNKGAVSMEELRQQLGERLAGSFQRAAKAMGLTTGELSDLIATGKLAADDFLPKFARELDNTFGPGLAGALDSLSADIADFGNAIFEAQERVAKGGFIEGLRVALKDLSAFFRSSEGQAFFEKLGAAAGGFVQVLAKIPQYLDEIIFVLSVFAGTKALGVVTNLGTRFQTLGAKLKPIPDAVRKANTEFNAFGGLGVAQQLDRTAAAATNAQAGFITAASAVNTLSTRATVARGAMAALSASVGVLRGVFAALGGIPGLIITGLSLAFSSWLTSTDDVIDATSEHQRQMEALLGAYDKVTDKSGDWAKNVKDVSLAGAEKTLDDLGKQTAASVDELVDTFISQINRRRGAFTAEHTFGPVIDGLKDLARQVKAGKAPVRDFAKQLDELLKAPDTNDALRDLIRDTAGLSDAAQKNQKMLAEQAVAVEQLGGKATSVQPLVKQLGISLETMANEAANTGGAVDKGITDPVKDLKSQFDDLVKKVPELSGEFKELDTLQGLDEILRSAELIADLDKSNGKVRELIANIKSAKVQLSAVQNARAAESLSGAISGNDGGASASAELLRRFEGFSSKSYFDVNAFRAGFGSDTVTLEDGSVKKITEGMTVTLLDANRDLIRRIGEFQQGIVNKIGADRFNEFDSQQQAALTSVAYNYGSLPDRIIEAVKTGSAEQIADAIRGLAGDNNGVNSDRRQQEAFLFEGGADPVKRANEVEKSLQRQIKAEGEKAKKEQEYLANLDGELALKAQAAETDKKMTREQTIQLAVAKEQEKARKAGVTLDEARLVKIREIAGAEYDRLNATKEQEDAEKRLNLLQQQRRDLIAQMELAQESGSTEVYATLQQQLIGLDSSLGELINKMIAFWEAIGGDKAAAAIEQLRLLKAQIDGTRQTTVLTSFAVGKLFGENIQKASDNFLAKIRETGDVIGSLKDAFRQFASDFLLQIAQMILKQVILNGLMLIFNIMSGGAPAASGGFSGGVLSSFGVNAGVQHTGGIAGDSNNASRTVSPAWFTKAVRYHSGGIAGLKPNEVPSILEKGEEVLPESDPRHSANGGGMGGNTEVKIVNTIDAGSFVSAGVEDVQGQKAILNFMRANQAAAKSALGI